MITFEDFKIKKQLQNAIADLGFEKPTPIQLESYSPILAGSDFVGIAQTGTGKTMAYLFPVLPIDQNVNIHTKTKLCDKKPICKQYFKQSTFNPKLTANHSVFFISPTVEFFNSNLHQPHMGISGFDHQSRPALYKIKSASSPMLISTNYGKFKFS